MRSACAAPTSARRARRARRGSSSSATPSPGAAATSATTRSSRAARRLSRDGRAVEWLDAGVNAWGPENVLGFVRETGGFDSSVWIVVGLADDFRREKTHVGEVP